MSVTEKVYNKAINNKVVDFGAKIVGYTAFGFLIDQAIKVKGLIGNQLEKLLTSETATAAINSANEANHTLGDGAYAVLNHGQYPLIGLATVLSIAAFNSFMTKAANAPLVDIMKYNTRGGQTE